MLICETDAPDQVAGLRRMAKTRPVKVIAVSSGKGGVGKTNVSVNLSLALGAVGHKVMLLDGDLGLANVDLLLGLRTKYNLSHVIDGKASLDEVIIDGPEGLMIIPASSGTQAMASLSPVQHAGIIRAFSDIKRNVDTLVIDTSAGIADSVISLIKAAHETIVVVCDEPTSLTDAYALIKVLSSEHDMQRFHVLANMVHSPQEGLNMFAKLINVTDRYLDASLDYLGCVPYDDYLRKSVKKQQAVMFAYPQSPSAHAFRKLGETISKWPLPQSASGNLEFFVERLIQYSAVGAAVE